MTLETSDQQKMTAHFPQPQVRTLHTASKALPPSLPPSLHPQRDPLPNYMELVGKVGPDLSLQVERLTTYGSEFGEPSENVWWS